MTRRCLVATGALLSAALAAASPYTYINVTDAPCHLDNTGATDVTKALQACIDGAFGNRIGGTPLFFPPGRYLLSDTVTILQTSGWDSAKDDGINVCPARFASHVLIGAKTALPARPTFVLAAASPGFAAAKYKPLFRIYNNGGEGIDMNNVFMGFDIDLTAGGNPGAVGVSHPGAQGATVQDVTVRAASDTYACFAGLNGAGGLHANIACYGARYGVYIDDCQPVPVLVGATLVNQSISAIVSASQEALSVVGTVIVVPAGATGAAISCTSGGSRGMSLVDVSVSCASPSASVAVGTTLTLYARDLYVAGCGSAIKQSGAPTLAGPPAGQWLHVAEWAKGTDDNQYYRTNVVYVGGNRSVGGAIDAHALLPVGTAPPPDLQSQHLWDEATAVGIDTPLTANAVRDCGAVGDNVTDDTAALQVRGGGALSI